MWQPMGNSHRESLGQVGTLAQLRDPASMNTMKRGQGRFLMSTLGFHNMHRHVQAHDSNMKTYACMPHTHIHILKIHKKCICVWWCMFVIPALRKLRQENQNVKSSLGCTGSFTSNKQKNLLKMFKYYLKIH